MKVLEPKFYLGNGLEVAKGLLGKFLVREEEGKAYYFKIVETEGYMGAIDKGAHVYGEKKTERTRPLYEVGGTTYIYLIYGMYHCLNIAAGKENEPYCALIRAVEPLDDEALQYARNNRNIKSKKDKDLTNGPGKLCKALHIDKSLNEKLVTQKGELWIADHKEDFEIVSAKRINIDYAEEYAEKPWRFYIKDNPYVSVIEKDN